jgi:Protein of unknown function (DUF1571)
VRRLLIMSTLGLLGVFGLSALGLYGLTRGYFESIPEHPQEPESPVLDTTAALPTPDQFETLARTDPVAFLRTCLLRYRKEVQGYQCTLVKLERLNGKVGPVEVIAATFQEEPFSVLLAWKSSSAGMADKALYVAGANGGMALARGKILHLVHHRHPFSAEAMNASRYALPEFGMAKGTERSLAAWERAAARGALKVEYLGIRPVPEAGGVPCYVLRRTCDIPEEDGVVAVDVSVDVAHWLQVGNVLTAAENQPIAAYYFRDIVLNPVFAPDQFDARVVK